MLSKNIVFWTLLCWLAMLASCATTHQDEVGGWELSTAEPGEEIEYDEQFSATNLTADNLSAFESRARQKLEDFFELLGIIGDPNYDSAFRRQAIALALDLFSRQEAILFPEDENTTTVEQYLEEVLESKLASKYVVKHISLLSPFSQQSVDRYQAVLSYRLDREGDPLKMNVVLVKQPKFFGQDKRYVWEVLLDGVK